MPTSLAQEVQVAKTGRAWPAIVAAGYLILSVVAPVALFLALMRAALVAQGG